MTNKINEIFQNSYRIKEDVANPKGTIKNWKLIFNWQNEWVINGDVYNHEEFSDGDNITTSTVKCVEFDAGYAQTKNSVYKLEGQPRK